jgi:hypothetical protein
MTEGFTVLVTGPDGADVESVALEIDGRLRGRHVPAELIDSRTPGVAALRAEGAATFVAGALARHGVVTVVALPVPSRASRDRARAALGRLIEVYVPSSGPAGAAYEPPLRAEVEVALPEVATGMAADRVLRTIELLGFLEPQAGTAYSEDEEREVIKRLKAFGYL